MLWKNIAVAVTILAALAAGAMESRVVDFDYVLGRAKELAKKPYDDRWGEVPKSLLELTYEQYQNIQFDPLKALWRDGASPFRIEFFHTGYIYTHAVIIHEFTESHEQEIPFSPGLFSYDKTGLGRSVPSSLSYAGFRVLTPLHEPERFEEIAAFQGSSYFRVRGRDRGYGLSARGIAINTVSPQPEEFPSFREFWVGKPATQAVSLVVYALLDGPGETGAYAFTLNPTDSIRVDVRATLFFRKPPLQLGLAPFSSMFAFGENTFQKPPDYRLEVHDSDGLVVADGKNRIWRPLVNPPDRSVSEYPFKSPVTFGLLQRDRDFNNYQDMFAGYHRRTSAWVEPGDWGAGKVLLYEFAAMNEANDNVVAFWEPEKMPVQGEPYSFNYTLHFDDCDASALGRVVATRTGLALYHPDLREFVVDFKSKRLAEMPAVAQVKAVVSTAPSTLIHSQVLVKNPYNETWRLILQFELPRSAPHVDIEAHLEYESAPLSETWSYGWVD